MRRRISELSRSAGGSLPAALCRQGNARIIRRSFCGPPVRTGDRSPSGAGREQCVRCHTAPGFRNFIANAGSTNGYATNTVYEAITCAACHDPHDATNPHQLRAANSYTLPEGTTVTNVGLGGLRWTFNTGW